MSIIRLLFFLIILFVSTSSMAQNKTGNIEITGDSLRTMILTTEGLLKMKQITLVAKGHDEKMHKYEGVLLLDVLSSAGVKFGEKAKKTTSASYVLVKGADNYRVIFSLAEIDTLFTDKKIMIASMEDNSPLPSNVGPFQIVAPGEKKHSRWVRQVVSIKVVTVY